MKNIMYFGGTCQSPALSALVRPPFPNLQPPLDLKQILPFSLESSAINLFPNLTTSQASAHYKGTKHAKKLKALEALKIKKNCFSIKDNAKTTFTPIIPTNNINGNSERKDTAPGMPTISLSTTLEIKKISVMTTEATSKVDKKITLLTSSICPSGETEEEKAKRLLYCSLCKVAVNSASQLEAHNSGTKHKTMMEARNGSGTIKAFPRAGVKGRLFISKGSTGLQNKTFHCEICDVHVNSETQLKQHISSRRHKDRAAGKPPKPKYSPYNKVQKTTSSTGSLVLENQVSSILAGQPSEPSTASLLIKLALSKQRLKPLSTRILPNPLAAAAAAAVVAANPTFSLRTTPAATLFQTSALPSALLRPAPGPIRTSHTPVLFAPY